MKQFIIGGMRSGKSRLAEQLAKDSGKNIIYVATSVANDKEMQARVIKHQQYRPEDWQTIEEPIKLAEVLQHNSRGDNYILVDCLTLWLTNLLMSQSKSILESEIEQLINVLPKLPGEIIFVSNETGLGVIPMGELTRRFCDEAGLLHQKIAKICDRVIFTVAGLPHVIKGKDL
ncbi:MAG: bifunctional adenosylcobinamide kinase/adenosylcobinamide-phosphate guanylyltransferase [Gammaproteobacteria bacterium]|nr:bifunctional adenosylcobinamide kinase/adenosylcobinamide-phosphate guanylyltransferase [Gammaproteobacteria bacterium]